MTPTTTLRTDNLFMWAGADALEEETIDAGKLSGGPAVDASRDGTISRGMEFTTDSSSSVKTGAIKYDGGKSPVYRGAVSYFPRALRAVADVSAFGASKYAWKGWENVPEGFERYSDALVRHLGYEGQGELTDSDSGLLHAAHAAWNSLARLELLLKELECRT